MGLVALWHVESSQTRDQTHAPCIGRRILNHWTPRDAHREDFKGLVRSLSVWAAVEEEQGKETAHVTRRGNKRQ